MAFHCQQAIEKSLKAIIEEFCSVTVKTHNLQTLIYKTEEIIILIYNEALIAEIDRLYIDARYLGEMGLMPWGKPSMEETNLYYQQAKDIKKQVEEHLKRNPHSYKKLRIIWQFDNLKIRFNALLFTLALHSPFRGTGMLGYSSSFTGS